MKKQKEKTEKTKNKFSIKDIGYLWYGQIDNPSFIWYKVYKWICYIFGSFLILLGILRVISNVYVSFSPGELVADILLVLVGVFFAFYFSKDRVILRRTYGDAKIEEWKAQEAEEEVLQKKKG